MLDSPRWAVAVVIVSTFLPLAGQIGETPLSDLGPGTYQGFTGGLYPGGVNYPPQAHGDAARALAAQVVPRDASGNPDPDGKIGYLAIGLSNANQEFRRFERQEDLNPGRDAAIVIVDGAVGGQDSSILINPAATYWSIVAGRVAAAGLSPQQVQVVWLKEANASPSTFDFPAHAVEFKGHLAQIVQFLKATYPQLRLCYLTSRTFGGYNAEPHATEPYSYESGFAVKWLIEDQINGAPELRYGGSAPLAPLLLWNAYLWADGPTPRSDGLVWLAEDFEADGVHPNASGEQKVADLLSAHHAGDALTRAWYRADPVLDLRTLDVTDDATVDSTQPFSNFGLLPQLGTSSGDRIRHTFLRFDLSGIAEPIRHVKLSLETINESIADVRWVTDSAWDETTITFAGAPPIGALLYNLPSWSRQTAISADVTVEARLDDDGIISFAITDGTPSLALFDSKESSRPPRLIVSVDSFNLYMDVNKVAAELSAALAWNSTNAPLYTVRRAEGPTPADFASAVVFQTPDPFLIDPGALGDPSDYYYLVDPEP